MASGELSSVEAAGPRASLVADRVHRAGHLSAFDECCSVWPVFL